MTIDKRTLLRAGLSASTALVAQANGMATAQADTCETPSVGGEFSCDAQALAATTDDFGHLVRKKARAVFRPKSVADIAGLLQWAGSRGLKVVARGQGHSTYGRAMADGGVVVDMTTMSAIHDVQPDRIVVDAGASWKTVLNATLAHGLTPPVLTNYLELSVGGTLAVGGIGGTTSVTACRQTMCSRWMSSRAMAAS